MTSSSTKTGKVMYIAFEFRQGKQTMIFQDTS